MRDSWRDYCFLDEHTGLVPWRVLKFLHQPSLWSLTLKSQICLRKASVGLGPVSDAEFSRLNSQQNCSESWPLPLSVIALYTSTDWILAGDSFLLCPGKCRSWEADTFSELYHCLNLKEKTCQGCSFEKLTKGHVITSCDKENWSIVYAS